MKLNVPNLLTFLRISLIPIFVLMFYLPFKGHHMVTAIIFAIAALTDWLDGYLARKLHQVSPLGEFLDPVADKLMVAVALILLVQSYGSAALSIPAAIIVSREIAISALREWMAELGKRHRVAVTRIGKFKTAVQMMAIFALLCQDPSIKSWMMYFGYVCLYVAALLTLWSMAVYLRIVWEEIKAA